ncbi:MAG: 4Fe-4S binding protein [Rhodobacteraceae bacterium]|nr:4Fe-4S binding protein [Paracoccaceae bacterium]
MAMMIDSSLCTACGDCEPVCPTGAIIPSKGLFTIKADICTECEPDHDMPQCLNVCMEDGCIVPVED